MDVLHADRMNGNADNVVLLVEDEAELRAQMGEALVTAGFVVVEAASGKIALESLERERPAVVILDLGLPDLGGLDVLTTLRETSDIVVIVVSGRSGETDRVVGLNLGADDYLVKPISTRELVARINAALRRVTGPADEILDFGELTIDGASCDVRVRGAIVALTAKEFELLHFLASTPRQVYNREQLLAKVWGSSSHWQDDNTVGQHVHRVRRKLDPENRTRWIETVRGFGYRFVP